MSEPFQHIWDDMKRSILVEQCDREAAADILDEVSNLLGHVGIGQVADLIRDGEYDEHEVVRLAARHRTRALEATQSGSDWFAGDVDCDGNELVTIRADELQKLKDDREKFMWQVRDTCARAEKAEAALSTQPQTEAGEPVAWFVEHPDYPKDLAFLPLLQGDKDAGWTETPLYATSKSSEGELLGAALDATSSLVAAISILRRAHDERKEPRRVVASDKMFLQMLDDYEKSVGRARAAIFKAGKAKL